MQSRVDEIILGREKQLIWMLSIIQFILLALARVMKICLEETNIPVFKNQS